MSRRTTSKDTNGVKYVNGDICCIWSFYLI
jgi:hypothetical protein